MSSLGIVFSASGQPSQSTTGIYREVGGLLEVVADETTPVPGGVGGFSFAILPALNDEGVVFAGVDSSGNNGIYLSRGASIEAIADRATPLPQGGAGFGGFSLSTQAEGSRIAFEGVGFGSSPHRGIYLYERDNLCLSQTF